MKYHGEHMSTDARENISHYRRYLKSVTNPSPTHTLWEDANTTRNSGPLDITTRLNYYMTSSKHVMEENGQSSACTWEINQ
jgi:hypothetical protein